MRFWANHEETIQRQINLHSFPKVNSTTVYYDAPSFPVLWDIVTTRFSILPDAFQSVVVVEAITHWA